LRTLVLLGLMTRFAVVPLLGVIAVALYLTKIATFPKVGFWSTLHEGTTDASMLLIVLFLLLVGGGDWSLDAVLQAGRSER
jgi:putative oxidoreductase